MHEDSSRKEVEYCSRDHEENKAASININDDAETMQSKKRHGDAFTGASHEGSQQG